MEHDGEDASEDGMDDGQGPSFKSLSCLVSGDDYFILEF